MGKSFLSKWRRQKRHDSPEVGAGLDELMQLEQARPTLAGPIAVFREILPLLAEIPHEPLPKLSQESATAKLQAGIPLLRGETVPLDERAFRYRWNAVCSAVARHQQTNAARGLAKALRSGRPQPNILVQEFLSARPDSVHALANANDLDPGLTATVLRLTFFPVLVQVNAAWAMHFAGVPWNRGYCPTCGSWPLLAELRGLEQVRFLRCGWCAADWEFPRLLCPFCAVRDHKALGYLQIEGEELRHRIATCNACRGYVKMMTTLKPLSPVQLLVADVATLHLDLAAAQGGYVVAASG